MADSYEEYEYDDKAYAQDSSRKDKMDRQPTTGPKTQMLNRTAVAMARKMMRSGGREKFPTPPNFDRSVIRPQASTTRK